VLKRDVKNTYHDKANDRSPEDVATAVLFLAGEMSSWISGSLAVGGGRAVLESGCRNPDGQQTVQYHVAP